MTHTPGPWGAQFSYEGGYDCMTDAWHISASVGGRWPAPIATLDLRHYGQTSCDTASEMTKEKADADARLIASAPDLLAACLIALPLIVNYVQGNQEAADIIEAAIAKAANKPQTTSRAPTP